MMIRNRPATRNALGGLANRPAANQAVAKLKANGKVVEEAKPAVRGLRARDTNVVQLNDPRLKGKTEKPEPKVARVEPLQPSASSSRRLSRIPVPASARPITGVQTIVEEDAGHSAARLPPLVEDIDADDGDNVMLTPEFVIDIYKYLRKLEVKQCVSADFLSIQREMTPRMRSVLVDWIVNVHAQFRLLPETLYLGISVMDRFFQTDAISKDKIQLVGVTALFVASKFEEIYPPTIDDLVSICDNLYGKRDIIKMEMAIVKRLRFELGRPLPLHFLRRNSKAAHASPKIHTLAKFLMELSLLNHVCSSWSPSLLAATALFVTLKVMSDDPDNCWNPTIQYYSNYKESDLLPCASYLCSIILKSETWKYQNVRKKYSHPKMMEISKSPLLKCDFIRSMAQKAMDN